MESFYALVLRRYFSATLLKSFVLHENVTFRPYVYRVDDDWIFIFGWTYPLRQADNNKGGEEENLPPDDVKHSSAMPQPHHNYFTVIKHVNQINI